MRSDHGEIDADSPQRQHADHDAERGSGDDADGDGKPDIVKRTAGPSCCTTMAAPLSNDEPPCRKGKGGASLTRSQWYAAGAGKYENLTPTK